MKMSKGTYQEPTWLQSVLEDETVSREFKIFIEIFDGVLQSRDTTVQSYINKNMKDIVAPPALLKNLRRGSLPPLYCLRHFDFLNDEEVDYLEWFMVNKDHITRKKYIKHNVDDIFEKWEGKPCPENASRFSKEDENKTIRRFRRKQQLLKYLQRAYELGV